MLRGMKTKGSEQWLLLAGGLLLAVGVAMGFTRGGGLDVPALLVRWLGIAAWMILAARRRSVTPWIFVAMVAGAELGVDSPAIAVGLRVFSDIFLRLIKTIVAPLIFATLVTGIAGHGDLKGVGRIGVKSLVYFEVVTTLALAVGLVAINLTRAGVGLEMVASAAGSNITTPPAPEHWQDFLMHVFPENI